MKNIVMFCGKGGVGKTTCAAATALHYANKGKKTIIISTDFTPSLRDIYEIDYLDEIGYEEIERLWDQKFGPEVYGVFSTVVDISYEEFVAFVATIVPGIRDEFMVDYIRELSESAEYERIVWDTAPAGQTLGLLGMPSIVNEHSGAMSSSTWLRYRKLWPCVSLMILLVSSRAMVLISIT